MLWKQMGNGHLKGGVQLASCSVSRKLHYKMVPWLLSSPSDGPARWEAEPGFNSEGQWWASLPFFGVLCWVAASLPCFHGWPLTPLVASIEVLVKASISLLRSKRLVMLGPAEKFCLGFFQLLLLDLVCGYPFLKSLNPTELIYISFYPILPTFPPATPKILLKNGICTECGVTHL